MSEHLPGTIVATIRSLAPSLLPAENAVAQVFLSHSEHIVELSSTQVAELAGASRATVVRTCQSLGFSGYQQLRVLLARDAGLTASTPEPSEGAAGIVAHTFAQVASAVPSMTALLDPEAVAQAVRLLARARRVLISGNGLSASLAVDTAARLSAIGRPAEAPSDAIAQQISARLMGAEDLVVIVSGSGANEASLKVASAGLAAGATVIVVTSFARSPLASMASTLLIAGMADLSFADEVTVTTRIPHLILVEGLIAAVAAEMGTDAVTARNLALDVVSNNLAE